MGDLISKPEFGPDCIFLTGTIFPAGETPKHLLCAFFDIIACALAGGVDPPNGSLKLTQTAPCVWEGTKDNANVFWGTFGVFMLLTAESGGDQWFRSIDILPPTESSPNALVACVPVGALGINGTGRVEFSAYEANSYELSVDFNFVPPDLTYYTEFMADDVSPVISTTRLSSHRWSTNCLIKRER